MFAKVFAQTKRIISSEIFLSVIGSIFAYSGAILNYYLVIRFKSGTPEFEALADSEISATVSAVVLVLGGALMCG